MNSEKINDIFTEVSIVDGMIIASWKTEDDKIKIVTIQHKFFTYSP